MTKDNEGQLEKVVEYLIEKLELKTIRSIERIELNDTEENPRGIDVYDLHKECKITVTIKYI